MAMPGDNSGLMLTIKAEDSGVRSQESAASMLSQGRKLLGRPEPIPGARDAGHWVKITRESLGEYHAEWKLGRGDLG